MATAPLPRNAEELASRVDAVLARWQIVAVFDDPEAARLEGLEAIALATILDDQIRIAWANLLVGGALAARSAIGEARRHLSTAEAIFRAEGEAIGVAHTLLRSSLVSTPADDVERAARDLGETLAIARAAGDAALEAMVLSDLAVITASSGDVAGAMRHFSAALDLAHRAGDETKAAFISNNIGSTLVDIGDIAGARPWLEDTLRAAEASGHRAVLVYPLVNLARCRDHDGDAHRTIDLLERACAVATAVALPAVEAGCWEEIGRLRRLAGHRSAAKQAYARAAEIYATLQAGSWPAEAAMAAWHIEDEGPPSPDVVEALEIAVGGLAGDTTASLKSEIHELLASADAKLYLAKERGRNQVRWRETGKIAAGESIPTLRSLPTARVTA